MATAITKVPREQLVDEPALRALIGSTMTQALVSLLGADYEPIRVEVMGIIERAQVLILADAAPPVEAYGVLATLPRRGRVLLSRFPSVGFSTSVDLVVKVYRPA